MYIVYIVYRPPNTPSLSISHRNPLPRPQTLSIGTLAYHFRNTPTSRLVPLKKSKYIIQKIKINTKGGIGCASFTHTSLRFDRHLFKTPQFQENKIKETDRLRLRQAACNLEACAVRITAIRVGQLVTGGCIVTLHTRFIFVIVDVNCFSSVA